MIFRINSLILTFFALALNAISAFAPLSISRAPTQRNAYIEADDNEDGLDPKGSGLGLALDNGISISGSVDSKGTPIAKGMKHYSKVIKSDISSLGAKVLCKGEGLEIYQDPGLSTEKSITLAPHNAVKDALSAIESQDKDGKIFINFTGGDDLMVHEVLEGVQMMVEGLSLSTNVEFKTLCEPTFPMDKCGVAAVSVSDDSNGQIYFNGGEWYTLAEEDVVASH
jgi:hypothetical protein